MKRLTCAALALLLAMALCACGAAEAPDSPYAGVWTATSAQFAGTEVPIAEVFPDGMVLELQKNGVCQLTLGEQSDPASWSETDGNLTISDGETDLLGTVDETAIVLEISGMYITLTRESAPEEGEAQAEAAPEEAQAEAAPEEAPAEEEAAEEPAE